MYVALLITLLIAGAVLVRRGIRRRSRSAVALGAALLVLTPAFFWFLGFWGELLWFSHMGLSRRFWTVVFAKAGAAATAALVSAGLALLVTRPARRVAARPRRIGIAAAALVGAAWGALQWDVVLRWIHRVDTGVREPILGRDVGFYLFALPFYDALFWLLVTVAIIALVVGSWSLVRAEAFARYPGGLGVARDVASGGGEDAGDRTRSTRAVLPAAGAFSLVLAYGALLRLFHVLYSGTGVVYGPGYTDVHVRIPAYGVVAAVLALGGLLLFVPRVQASLERRASRRGISAARLAPAIGALPLLAGGAIWVIGLVALPALLQWLKVTPNELALERPYLENNIAFSRRGYGLDKVESRQFEMTGKLTPELVDRSDALLSEVRLWDPKALDQVLEQFQEIRLYYEITSVDIDRYTLGKDYRQVMVAPREMETRNLPPDSQTFVNRHFKYTHGYGLAMAPVSDFTPDGLPHLVVRDIPPVSEFPSVSVERPEIYYGERTNDYVIVNSHAAEFHHPSGAENVYVHYAGEGGVELGGLWRKIVYGWKLGGTRLLFSEYPRDESRVMFHRNVRERLSTIAPFLKLDADPYAVLVDGRVKWIVDAYTTSTYFPYSEPLDSLAAALPPRVGATPPAEPQRRLGDALAARHQPGTNYVRNSVKAVIDAYDGSVALYAFDAEDPILRVWSRIFPDLFRPASEMPASVRAHVRYPEGFLHTQGVAYAKYHMTDPEVFYNQEDLWVRATEKHYGDIRIVEPYFVMWQPPDSLEAEFIIMQPYTPKHRQVLIGWLAGMCDGDNYGRLLAYRFPKDRLVIGPQQVDTKIDQDAQLSAQLTLWDQHGKRVIRGNVLAIPLGNTILYVEPIYIQAQDAAYPELRAVVAMHGDDMSHAPTFREALEGLLAPGAPRPAPVGEAARAPGALEGFAAETLDRAQQAFDAYVRLMGEGRFVEAAAELERLREALRPTPPSRELPSR